MRIFYILAFSFLGFFQQVSAEEVQALATTPTQPAPVAEEQVKDAKNLIQFIVYMEPDLFLMTPGSVVGGGLIDSMTRPDGSSIPLPSPSYLFAVSLREKLSENTSLMLEDVKNELTPFNGKIKKISNPTGKHSLLVFTELNFLGYRPLKWATYQYGYMARVRLSDPEGKTTWEYRCAVKPSKNDPTLQLDRTEFKNNDGEKLIDVVKLATSRCADQIVSQVIANKI